uniref:Uncharacterized protein n=1 Tax=Parascaris univalens TaxID=6257 RepID=A0A914ZZ06_PARUN
MPVRRAFVTQPAEKCLVLNIDCCIAIIISQCFLTKITQLWQTGNAMHHHPERKMLNARDEHAVVKPLKANSLAFSVSCRAFECMCEDRFVERAMVNVFPDNTFRIYEK